MILIQTPKLFSNKVGRECNGMVFSWMEKNYYAKRKEKHENDRHIWLCSRSIMALFHLTGTEVIVCKLHDRPTNNSRPIRFRYNERGGNGRLSLCWAAEKNWTPRGDFEWGVKNQIETMLRKKYPEVFEELKVVTLWATVTNVETGKNVKPKGKIWKKS